MTGTLMAEKLDRLMAVFEVDELEDLAPQAQRTLLWLADWDESTIGGLEVLARRLCPDR